MYIEKDCCKKSGLLQQPDLSGMPLKQAWFRFRRGDWVRLLTWAVALQLLETGDKETEDKETRRPETRRPEEAGTRRERKCQIIFRFSVSRLRSPFHCFLELSVLNSSWKGNNVPDILHAGYILDYSFKTQTKPCMGDTSVFSKIQVPPVIFFV